MNKEEEHRERHVELHRMLDELLADFISGKSNKSALLSKTSIMELMYWSYEQTLKPTEKGEKNGRDSESGKEGSSNEEGNKESIVHE